MDGFQHASGGAPSPAEPAWTLLDVGGASPLPLRVTWSKDALVPCRLGVRKSLRVPLLPLLRLKGKAEVNLSRNGGPRFAYGFSLRDALLGGRLSLNLAARAVEYQKKLGIPGGARAVLSAGVQYAGGDVVVAKAGGGGGAAPRAAAVGLRGRVRPFVGAALQLGAPAGDGGNPGGVLDAALRGAVFAGDGFALRPRLRLPLRALGAPEWAPAVELAVHSRLRVPQLTTRRSVFGGGPVALDDGSGGGVAEPLSLHVAAFEAIVRL